jgi:hypothetical protein
MMGVQPPTNDANEPAAIEFGIAALDARLDPDAVEFPATKAEIIDCVGHIEVPYDPAGHTITVADALDRVSTTEFETEQELLNTLHPVFERKREATTNSLLSQLRALVPF